MRYLYKFNESKVEYDIDYIKTIFVDIIEDESVSFRLTWMDFAGFTLQIGLWTEKVDHLYLTSIEMSERFLKISEICKDIDTCMARVKDEYPGSRYKTLLYTDTIRIEFRLK
jgi:hypothetical protein